MPSNLLTATCQLASLEIKMLRTQLTFWWGISLGHQHHPFPHLRPAYPLQGKTDTLTRFGRRHRGAFPLDGLDCRRDKLPDRVGAEHDRIVRCASVTGQEAP